MRLKRLKNTFSPEVAEFSLVAVSPLSNGTLNVSETFHEVTQITLRKAFAKNSQHSSEITIRHNNKSFFDCYSRLRLLLLLSGIRL